MKNSFPVIITVSRKRVHIHPSKQGNNQPGISSGSINPWPPALNDSPKAVLLLGELDEGHYCGIKLDFQNKKTPYSRC